MTRFVEGFEGVIDSANSPKLIAFFRVGALATYQFESGLRLVAPIPNDDLVSGVAVVDFAAGPASGIFGPGFITQADVPGETAFIRHKGGNISFDFGGAKVYVVGGYVDTDGATPPGIAAFDAAGNLVSGLVTMSVPIEDGTPTTSR